MSDPDLEQHYENERQADRIAELEAMNADLMDKLTAVRLLYDELLFGVASKYPNETRHKTALRYIQEAESSNDDTAKAGSER